MITRANCKSMFVPLWQHFCKISQGPPQHIYYFRDGVSEGQFTQVLDQEVAGLRGALEDEYKNSPEKLAFVKTIKWTVVVCTKRHHIRIFPKQGDNVGGDRNGNPNPGVLLEYDVTHPFEYDFYLNSHSAIQGTARPVHYQVILDEINPGPTKLQNMIYHHSYQYMRSTTPVSLCKFSKLLICSLTDFEQTLLCTMLIWQLLVVAAMKSPPMPTLLVVVKSMRRLDRMRQWLQVTLA